jgi:hypothetical protein
MNENLSITLSAEIITKIDGETGPTLSRSAVIERILHDYFDKTARRKSNAVDLKHINASVDRLNIEAADVLGYIAPTEDGK